MKYVRLQGIKDSAFFTKVTFYFALPVALYN